MSKMTITPEMIGKVLAGTGKSDGAKAGSTRLEDTVNYLFLLVEELNHVLSHLNTDNFSQSGIQDVKAAMLQGGIAAQTGRWDFRDDGIYYIDKDGNETREVQVNAE